MIAKNLLVICADEMARFGLGALGGGPAITPTLDRLATRGATFDAAYTPSPICVPARACLATGLQVHETRCWSSAEPFHGQHESWMRRLRDQAGWAVASVGKLHFRSADDDNGFSEEILPMHLANDGIGWPQALIRDRLPSFPEAAELAEGVGAGETDYTAYDRAIANAASNWIAARRGAAQPWALFVSFASPHYPLIAPDAFFDLYADVEIPEPDLTGRAAVAAHPALAEMAAFWDYDRHFTAETRRLARRAYFGLCSFVDALVGQVLAALDAGGAASETLTLFVSDHGEMLGERGLWTKSVMYEASAGVPIVAAGPGVTPTRARTPASLTDIAATAENLAGASRRFDDAPWASRSLLDLAATPDLERSIVSQYHDGGGATGLYMLRQGRWKLTRYANGAPDQLFDLDEDPAELDDRAGEDDAVQNRMRAALADILDIEAVDAQAFADQARRIDELGGRDAILSRTSFNHTPAPR